MALFNVNTKKIPSTLLTDRFIIPPLSIFDTTQGYWITHRAECKSLGIKGELGRDATTFNMQSWLNDKHKSNEISGHKFESDTSIFDPVLCEITYKWFTTRNATVLDPFAGGSVRGIVAGALGRHYTGIDLSVTQIKSNNTQFDDISAVYPTIVKPHWICGDSSNVKDLVGNEQFDLIFSCPPYYDLEVYSNDPNDLSAKQTYDDFFLNTYREIISHCCDLLKDNSFAVFVVGDIRDKKGGYYHNLVGDTISAFESCGVHYYNQCIIKNQVGTNALTSAKNFNSSRKLNKIHQNYLVFYKGNPKDIHTKFGDFINE